MTIFINNTQYDRITCTIKIDGKLKRRIYISEDGTIKYNDYNERGDQKFAMEYDILLGF